MQLIYNASFHNIAITMYVVNNKFVYIILQNYSFLEKN